MAATFSTTQLRDALLTLETFQYDADLLLCYELPASATLDLPHSFLWF